MDRELGGPSPPTRIEPTAYLNELVHEKDVSFRKPGAPASASNNFRKRKFDQLGSSKAQLARSTAFSTALLDYYAQSRSNAESKVGVANIHRPHFRSFSKSVRDDKAHRGSCCQKCLKMLGGATTTERPLSPDKEYVQDDVHDLNGTMFQVFDLRKRPRACNMCGLLLSLLGGPDGIALRRARIYGDDNSNQFTFYDENGVSDVDMYQRTDKLKVVLTTHLKEKFTRMHGKFSVLMVQFMINVRTQGKSRMKNEQMRNERMKNEMVIIKELLIFTNPNPDTNLVKLGSSQGEISPPVPSDILYPDVRLGPEEKANWIMDKILDLRLTPQVCGHIYPRRLLDVSSGSTIRLVDCGKMSPTPLGVVQYAALSHRWGASQHLTTTTKNMAEMHDGFDIGILPRTFQDAAFLARNIGIRFIWIDALCIVQDNLEDWLHQSHIMGDIYMNAQVTFAIHCASDDSDGFLERAFSKRPAVEEHIHSIGIGVCASADPEFDITKSSLSRRGWVLQERFLSSRTLHFTTGQVYWETAEGIFCEDASIRTYKPADLQSQGPEVAHSPPALPFSPSAFTELRKLFNTRGERTCEPPKEITPLEWLDLVELYSLCELTRDSDKLIALSGMARKVQTRTKQTWCAGIWADRLCEGLLWFPTDNGLTAPTIVRAPSWSWAAWDGSIQFPLLCRAATFVPRCQFIRVEDATGSSVDWLSAPGALTLRGLILAVDIWGNAGYANLTKIGPGPIRKGDPSEDPEDDLPRLAFRHYTNIRLLSGPDKYAFLEAWVAIESLNRVVSRFERQPSVPEAGRCCFLVLGTSLREHNLSFGTDQPESITCLGLFLEAVESSNGIAYKRLGAGQISWRYVEQQLMSQHRQAHYTDSPPSSVVLPCQIIDDCFETAMLSEVKLI